MKRLIFFTAITLFIATNALEAQQLYEPLYMGLNGKFTSIEITDKSGTVEVYTFDNQGRLSERRAYTDATKKTLYEKDTYVRNSSGELIDTYSGYGLNDNQYGAESRWRRIEKKDNTETWQKIDDSWYATSYRKSEYWGNQRATVSYIIPQKDKKLSILESVLATFNSRGQIIVEVESKGQTDPKNTTTKTYDDKGRLLKIELEQTFPDGSTNKTVMASYTIDKEDELGNPLQVTDDQGHVKVYKYFNNPPKGDYLLGVPPAPKFREAEIDVSPYLALGPKSGCFESEELVEGFIISYVTKYNKKNRLIVEGYDMVLQDTKGVKNNYYLVGSNTLSTADNSWIPYILVKGNKVQIKYCTCGSGAIREIMHIKNVRR